MTNMTQEEYQEYKKKYARQIGGIRLAAHELHLSVNDSYGDNLPYGVHLDMVSECVSRYGHLVCACEEDVVPLFFGSYFLQTGCIRKPSGYPVSDPGKTNCDQSG